MSRPNVLHLVVCLLLPVALATCTNSHAAAERHLNEAEAAFASGDFGRAVVEYRAAIKIEPKLAKARTRLAEAYLRTGDQGHAAAEYLRAADLLPDDVPAQISAGKALLVIGRFGDAKARAEAVLKLQQKNVEAQILLGYALAGLNDLNGAVKELGAAVEDSHGRADVFVNLGTLQLANGAREQAEAAFKTAIINAPAAVGPLLALSNFYLADGKVAEAEQVLQKAVQLRPPSAEAARTLGFLLLGMGRVPEAEQHLVAAAAASKDPVYRLALGDYYIIRGDAAKARSTFESLSGDETTAAGSLRLAHMDYAQGKHDQAYARVDAVLKTKPPNGAAHALKGQFLLQDGRPAEAIRAFSAAIAADPKLPSAHFGLGLASLALRDVNTAERGFTGAIKLNPRYAEAQVELGRLHLAAGKTDSALQLASGALQAQPRFAAARLLHAQALLAAGNISEAAAEAKALLDAHPNWNESHTLNGTVRLSQGDGAGAKAAFARAQELAPESLEALRGLLLTDRQGGSLPAARARIEARLAAAPNNPSLLILAADIYIEARDTPAAERTLKRLIELDPSNLQAYGRLGDLYMKERRLDDAVVIFTKASQQQPEAVGPRTMLAYIHHLRGETDEARKAYEAIVSLDSRAAVAGNNLAWIYAEKGENLDRALELVQAAKERLPDQPEVTDTLGWIYYKKDLAALAIPQFEQTVRKDPRNPEYQYHLGLAHLRHGDTAEAREHLQLALNLGQAFSGADDARRALASLPR